MNTTKISIIVPVYKVEPYLKRCVDSLLEQIYKNIEVILVDDGSPDKCPEICDEYAQKDKRVKVIHKPNGGLSSARNAGLDYPLQGDYVAFLDSDDWVDKDTYAYCTDLLRMKNAQAVQFGMRLVEVSEGTYKQPKEKIAVYKGKDVLQYYMKHSTEDSEEYSVCIGVYHKSLFDGIRFREGKINEDIDFKFRLMSKCNSLLVSNQIKYNYFQTGNTISMGGLKKKDFQLREAGDLLAELSAKETYGNIAYLGKVKQARTAFSLLSKIAYFGIADSSINKKEIVQELTAEHRSNLGVLLRSPMTVSRKILAIMFAISFNMTEIAIHLIKKL